MIMLLVAVGSMGQSGTFKISGQGTMKTSTVLPPPSGNSYTAASCSQADVDACVNSNPAGTCIGGPHTAVDGDVIYIPRGTCTWTDPVNVPVNIGITIMGAGTPNGGASTIGPSASCADQVNGTVITVNTSYAGNDGYGVAFRMTPSYGNSTSRISCMTSLQNPSLPKAGWLNIFGTCTSSGCPNLRMDNITLLGWNGVTYYAYGMNYIANMFGVLDHNALIGLDSPGYNFLELAIFQHSSYMGVGIWGDYSWTQPEDYGSPKFLFFENNQFTNSGATENEAIGRTGTLNANAGGSRGVARHNIFTVTGTSNFAMGWHGTESLERARGGRAFEFYENTWTCNYPGGYCPGMFSWRSGTGLIWGNTITIPSGHYPGAGPFTYPPVNRAWGNNRQFRSCSGVTGWDTNDLHPAYYSGVIQAISGASAVEGETFTVGPVGGSCGGAVDTPGWTANQWVLPDSAYSLYDVTIGAGTEITANGASTLTTNLLTWTWGSHFTAACGDQIEIRRALVCVDQTGRGAGILYSNATCGIPGQRQDGPCPYQPANQVISPTYSWLNSFSPAPAVLFTPKTPKTVVNREWYTETINQATQSTPTVPFNGIPAAPAVSGTPGVGHGTLANRPTSCTPLVGYWATDQNAGAGELYICTATNTWTASYTPYVYPHPLDY